MKIPHPRSGCQRTSELAAKNARQSARSMGWSERTIQSISPMKNTGGIVAINSSLKHINTYQEKGTKPYLMWWVQGRTVKMACKQGDGPHLRRGSHVGEPGYVNIPHVGQVWRDQRWRHPGIKPKHFMLQAIDEALQEDRPNLKRDVMALLKGIFRR